MTVQRSLSTVFKSLQKALDYPIPLLSSGAFDPASISGLRSRLLDANTFTSPIDSKYYLADSSTTNTHLPRQGRAWLFDGVNDYGVLPSGTNAVWGAGSFTFSCWIKGNGTAQQGILSINNSSSACLWLLANNAIMCGNGAGTRTTASNANTANTWTHLTLVYDTSLTGFDRWVLYVNGVLVSLTNAGVFTAPVAALADSGLVGTRNSGATFFQGSMQDIRIYSVAKNITEITAIYESVSGTFDTTGLLAAYPCNEESGTTGYDISGNGNHLTLTNITQATFHASDTGVLANRNNAEGYRLSGSVYIPKRLSDSLAADGNALTVTGRAAYHGCAETPCFTGNGSNTSITISSVLASITGDFEFTGWFKTGQTYGALWGNSTNGLYLNTLVSLRFYVGGVLTQFACTVVSGQWHYVRVTRTSGTVAMWLDNVSLTQNAGTNPSTGTITTTSLANGFSTFAFTGGLADFRFTVDGVTTYFPLQDGPGSSNTNRDVAWVKSDGTGGVISNAIVNGTVSTIWGNRVPGNVEDWCVKYGGRIAANGAFVAGMLSGGNAADGSAKTLVAGKFGNPFSRLNLNPATAAELNGRSVPTAAAVAADINATITPAESAFRRTASDGDDRILIYDDTLSGADLSNVEGYVA